MRTHRAVKTKVYWGLIRVLLIARLSGSNAAVDILVRRRGLRREIDTPVRR
jgi:hypothetical protein